MDRKSFAALALVAFFVSICPAQDTTALNLADLQSQVQSQFNENKFNDRVDRIPANYFADEETSLSSETDQATTSQQNLLILCCLASLLAAGGVITAISVSKRRRNARLVNVAPPVKLYA